MVYVNVGDRPNSFEQSLRKLRRAVDKAGILAAHKAAQFFEKPSKVKKRNNDAAKKRHSKKLARDAAAQEQAKILERKKVEIKATDYVDFDIDTEIQG